MRFKLLLFFTLFFGSFVVQAQEYLQMIDAGTYKVQEIIDSAEAYFANRDKGRGTGYKQFKRWEYNALRMMNENGYLPSVEERLTELEQWNAYLNATAASRSVLNDNWQELGPTDWNATSGWNPGVGRITGLAIEEGNENHMIIGANTGGVWRTIDGAQTWTPLCDYFSNLSVYSVAIDPLDSDTYFFGSTNGRIFKSTDAGATWNLLGTIGNSIVNKILINPSNNNIIFATAENVGIYRSTDSGVTWNEPVADTRGYDVEFKPGDLSVVYASGSGFHKSTDGGATFTTIGGFATGPKMIGVSANDPNTVYVLEATGSRFGGFYTSSNSGDSFTKINHGSLNFFGYSTSGNDNSGQAPRDMGIAVNPTNVNEVHIAGILTWRSSNGGTTFSCTSDWIPANAASQNIGYCHADVDDLQYYGTTLYAITDGGVYKAENTGAVNANYYEDLTQGLGIRQFYKIGVSQTADVIVSGGAQDNGTSFYTQATQWKDWLGADGMESFIDKTNSNIFYGTSQNGQLYRSQNGGNSYIGINEPGSGSGNWVTPFEQDPILVNTVYVGYNRVYKSSNLGGSWTSISQDLIGNLDNMKISPTNNQVMYVSRGPFLFRTEDAGATDWVQTAFPGGTINSIAIHPTNPYKIAVAITGNSRVMVSEDGGDTWIDYKKNLPNFSALALIWDNNGKDGLYLGMDYGIYYIDNTFTDWQPYSNLLPNVIINELDINNTTNMLYAATYGRGLWVSPLVDGTAGVNDTISEVSVSIYPNPARDSFTVALPKSLNAELRVFDISGKLLIYEAEALISNKHSVDVSSLSAGTYFVRINSEEGTATKKLLIN
ncbi:MULTISPECIES: T9SS type A sorting domain-containing protein [Aequorivita]|uniref:T9SS type A sorting domain-containing protein n=1 Tax=Aequorivita iocasae TaxID=2803865 RepID=A0ABX7DS26_9FLAO|nr:MULTISPECIES: T9SS type A sorting domain-containing protein [Aequorivita]QQX75589.1 T9SS type A sorting domain-containing protein [Aequorivita iocasae]UCA55044.1 T9SS type A sorting domain-containing protein [Aequorivita sp. F7]